MQHSRHQPGPAASARLIAHANSLIGFCVLLTYIIAGAATAQTAETDHETVKVTGTLTDVQFLAGRSVIIEANVSDDVFAAGRNVTFDSAAVNNAIAAGYDVEQRGGTATDFVALAANLKISGAVSDDLVAGARAVRISSDGSIGGDVRLAAETIDMEGQIGGSMRAAAARITIGGTVSGKVDLLARRIVVGPKARITGDLIYRSKEKPEIADGATIGGQVRQIPIETPDLYAVGWKILAVGLLIGLAWALATLLLVVILLLVFPELIGNSARNLLDQPWSNLGRGIAIGLAASVIAGLLMASLFGVPIGSALFMAIGVAWLLGLASVCAGIGLYISRRRQKGVGDMQTRPKVGWTVLGAVILGLVVLVPILGWLVASLAIAAGFGAATAELWQRLRHA